MTKENSGPTLKELSQTELDEVAGGTQTMAAANLKKTAGATQAATTTTKPVIRNAGLRSDGELVQ